MSSDASRIKAVIDLHEYLASIGHDRPRVAALLKELNIDPQTMWDCVQSTAASCQLARPEYTVDIINHLFKLGITIGYKYAIKKEMERTFGDLNPTQDKDKT